MRRMDVVVWSLARSCMPCCKSHWWKPTNNNVFSVSFFESHTDVKLGRGGDANSHIGNIKFRQLISQYKPRYTAASRSNKPLVAEEVVQIWRNLDPPGRFLIRTDPSLGDDSTWHDVGNRRARKKASQALREKDRSEDLVASLAHHGHVGIPGMAGVTPGMAPGVAPVPGGNAAANNMVAAAAAAMAAAANEQSRKRARQPDLAAMFGDRRVAPRQDGPTPGIDPALAARALQQLLQQGSLPGVLPGQTTEAVQAPPAVAPAPPVAPAPTPQVVATAQVQAQAPSSGSGLDALLLPALQLLLQQKQQQQQQQQQQTLSNLASAIQSLVSQGQQQQQQQQPANNVGNNTQGAQLASALQALLAGVSSANNPSGAPVAAPANPGSSQPATAAAGAVSNIFAQAAHQFTPSPAPAVNPGASQPAPAAAGVPNFFAQAASNQLESNGHGQLGSGNPQNLDRLLATRIIENLINPNGSSQRNGL
jgi:hypothetical protein